MPDIPIFVNDQDVHQGGAAQASPGAMGAVGSAIAQGAGRVADVMQAFNKRYTDAARSADAANIMAGVSQKLGDAQFRWGKTANRQDALDGFNKEAAELKKNTIGGIKDPLMAPLIEREFDSESAMRSIDTGQQAFRLESNQRGADLKSNLLSYAGSYAAATSDGVKAKIHDNAVAAIRMNVQGGWVTPEEGQAFEQNWGSQTQEVQVRKLYNDALASQDPSKVDALSQALADPNNFKGLLPEKREILAQRADQLQYRLDTRAATRQAHLDAVADREQRKAQGHNEAVILGSIYNGKDIDPVLLQQLGNSGQISSGGLETIHSAMDRSARGVDDASVAVRLWHDIDSGRATTEDVYAHAGRGLSADTAASMVRALDKKGPESDAAQKGAYAVLKTAMNGQAVEAGSFGGDKTPAVKAWASAQGEWMRRVAIGGEDPQNVLTDMIPRYAGGVHPSWLAKPKFGAVNSFADLQKAAGATKAAFASGQINQADAEAQGQLLRQYSLYYRAPVNHAPAKPKGEGK